MSPYFEFPDTRVSLNLRVDRSHKLALERLQNFWRVVAERCGEDPDQIDLSFVARRLLSVGIEGAWAEAGGVPKTEAEWEAMVDRAVKAASAATAAQPLGPKAK